MAFIWVWVILGGRNPFVVNFTSRPAEVLGRLPSLLTATWANVGTIKRSIKIPVKILSKNWFFIIDWYIKENLKSMLFHFYEVPPAYDSDMILVHRPHQFHKYHFAWVSHFPQVKLLILYLWSNFKTIFISFTVTFIPYWKSQDRQEPHQKHLRQTPGAFPGTGCCQGVEWEAGVKKNARRKTSFFVRLSG